MWRAEQLTPPLTDHGEGPVWSDSWGGLRFVDMLAGDVLQLENDGGVRRTHVGGVVAALRPRRGGGAVIAVERAFVLEDETGVLRTGPDLWAADLGLRMNEGGCDPAGRFYCGSMVSAGSAGRGSLYRLDVDGAVDRVLDGATVSNGLEWSPDGTRAYYVDTPTRRVDVFDFDVERGLTGRRPFVVLEPGVGDPDGLTVDADGAVWVALWGGGAVRVYEDDGTLAGVVSVPAKQVTACTLGGDSLTRLYITTSRHGLRSPGVGDGAVFVCEPGVVGLPVRGYAG